MARTAMRVRVTTRLTTKTLDRELEAVVQRYSLALGQRVEIDPAELDALITRLEGATDELHRLLDRANVNARGDAWETDLVAVDR